MSHCQAGKLRLDHDNGSADTAVVEGPLGDGDGWEDSNAWCYPAQLVSLHPEEVRRETVPF